MCFESYWNSFNLGYFIAASFYEWSFSADSIWEKSFCWDNPLWPPLSFSYCFLSPGTSSSSLWAQGIWTLKKSCCWIAFFNRSVLAETIKAVWVVSEFQPGSHHQNQTRLTNILSWGPELTSMFSLVIVLIPAMTPLLPFYLPLCVERRALWAVMISVNFIMYIPYVIWDQFWFIEKMLLGVIFKGVKSRAREISAEPGVIFEYHLCGLQTNQSISK